ncbi:superoxide dismutase [Ohtaekwangia sp.]|uniref:superoxide dismutase n=1 Tax=Ohtaekwangia sp. TaxID=2066019 RepID=UPI002F9296B1
MKTTRREFVQQALKATTLTALGTPLAFNALADSRTTETTSSPFDILTDGVALQFAQVPLPYAYAALEPSIDAMTMEIHYTKHHTAYIKNVNEAIAADKISFGTEKEFFANASKLSAKARNNGGGAWNHNFFWQTMKPGAGQPGGKLAEAINSSFGSFDKFKEQFTQAAMTRFGSGWAWLVNEGGKLKIGSTPNQDNPLMDVSELKGTPLLGLDVWEHAYYLKYQNKRNEYVANWYNVINWDEVAKRLA